MALSSVRAAEARISLLLILLLYKAPAPAVSEFSRDLQQYSPVADYSTVHPANEYLSVPRRLSLSIPVTCHA